MAYERWIAIGGAGDNVSLGLVCPLRSGMSLFDLLKSIIFLYHHPLS